MDIVLCATRNMYPQLQAMMIQLKQTQSSIDHIYALVEDDITSSEPIVCINVNNYPKIVNNQTNYNNYWTYISFARCYLPDILPNIDKILYLDLDLYINQDISALWNIDISNYAIGGVIDLNIRNFPLTYIDNLNCYINSGVLLMNLKYFREHNLVEKLDYLLNHWQLRFPDQDALNIVCQGHIKYLSHKWNSGRPCGIHDEPIIRHCSSVKPWDPNSKWFLEWTKMYYASGMHFSVKEV